jgi:hypothetical protein
MNATFGDEFKKLLLKRVNDLTCNDHIQDYFFSFFGSDNFSKIKKKSILECVIIEPRKEKHLKRVLNNFTTILPYASFTIFHSNQNASFVKNIIGNNHNFNLKLLPHNFDRKQYSIFLSLPSFWKQLHGEKILIFQVDTGIRRNDINLFWEYSYIGAPWDWAIHGNPNIRVGNGGFSLRDRLTMVDVCEKFQLGENEPEDAFFATKTYNLPYTKIPSIETAYKFSIEFKSSQLDYDYDSMGFHQIIDKWRPDFLINYFSKFDKSIQYIIEVKNVWVETEKEQKVYEKLTNWIQISIGPCGLKISDKIQLPYIEESDCNIKLRWCRTDDNKLHLTTYKVVNKMIVDGLFLN